MSHHKRASRSGPLPDISSESICQPLAIPAEVLHLHLANYHLITAQKLQWPDGFLMPSIVLAQPLPLSLRS